MKRKAFAAVELTDQEVGEVRAIGAKVNEAAALLNGAIRNYANHKVKRPHAPQSSEVKTASVG